MRSTIRLAVVAAAVAGIGGIAPPALAHGHHGGPQHGSAPVVVVSGLNNPRQLDLVGPELLIAEAGRGGDTPITGPDGEPTFVGPSGSISSVFRPWRVHDSSPHRIVTGLLSGAGEDGSFAVGSDGVTARRPFGPVYVQMTWAPPDVLPAPLGSEQDGKLIKAWRHDGTRSVADIAAFEFAHDPDGHGPDSNPYAVIARAHDFLVADAAANDVLRVDRHGGVHLWHVFPNVRTGACASQSDPDPAHPGCNFVPTSLAHDRRGHVYVGGLSSLTPGEAQVVKLSADGRHVLRVWGGFSAVTGVAVGPHGSLYVSELFAAGNWPPAADPNQQITGVLTKIDRHGHRTHLDVPFPAGLAADRHGTVYVAAWSIAPDTGVAGPGTSGQVWRLRF